ncbi:MAG: alkaline phosphatase family protein [Ethanoligenens sp.]
MGKVVFVVLDGLNLEASRHMGFMEHLTETGVARKYTVRAELPTLSRPLYEVLLTGVPVFEHEVFSNDICRLSKEQHVFSLARAAGRTTAAAAYYWMSELYNRAPFAPADRFQLDVDRPIQHGVFYFEDSYPDSHLFCDAEFLRLAYRPDFLLVHSMNVDDAGHKYGGNSAEYAATAAKADGILAHVVKDWLADGYAVVVTADHGMNASHFHNGTSDEERLVPLYIAGAPMVSEDAACVQQLEVAPLLCELLDVPKSGKMLRQSLLANQES